MPCRATQDRQVMVEISDKIWSTGEGNGKPLQYSCLENPMNSEIIEKIKLSKVIDKTNLSNDKYLLRFQKLLTLVTHSLCH